VLFIYVVRRFNLLGSMETREGVLELLLVSAEGLKHAHHHPRRL
jgi:hypothetical protein